MSVCVKCECIFEMTFCFEAQAALVSTTSYLNDQSARSTGKHHGTSFVVLTDYEVQLSPLGCFNIMFHLFVCLTGRLSSAHM